LFYFFVRRFVGVIVVAVVVEDVTDHQGDVRVAACQVKLDNKAEKTINRQGEARLLKDGFIG